MTIVATVKPATMQKLRGTLAEVFNEKRSGSDRRGMKFDDGKLRYTLEDPIARREFVAVLTAGAVKYDPGNWASVNQWLARYGDAMQRHAEAVRMGELLDPETTLMHWAHAHCDVHFLLALTLRDNPDLAGSFDKRFAHAMKNAREQRAKRDGELLHAATGAYVETGSRPFPEKRRKAPKKARRKRA